MSGVELRPTNLTSYYDRERRPDWFRGTRLVTVVGAGALGSQIVLQLSKMGAGRIAVFDPDIIEAHNASNQLVYSLDDVGEHKVKALKRKIGLLAGKERLDDIIAIPHKVDDERISSWNWVNKSEVLFLCVDSLAARKNIVQRLIRTANKTRHKNSLLVVDGRMGAHSLEAWSFGFTVENGRKYLEGMGDDADIPDDVGSCGRTQNVGATACITVGHMMWLYLNALQKPREEVFGSVQSVLVDTRPLVLSHLTI